MTSLFKIAAKDHNPEIDLEEISWVVTFTDGENRTGKVTRLTEQLYRLDGHGTVGQPTVYYFSEDKVVRIYAK